MFTTNMRALGTSQQVCVKFLLKQAKQANLSEGDSCESYRGTGNAGVENAGVEISARSSRKRQGVENAGVEKSAR